MALTLGLLDSSQLGTILRAPKTSDQSLLDKIIEVGRLKEAQVIKLKNRALLARATRTFSLKEGSFVLESESALEPEADLTPIHAEQLVLQGVLTHYNVERLFKEAAFLRNQNLALTDNAVDALAQAGISNATPVLKMLEGSPHTVEQLAAVREIGEQAAWAHCYALAACNLIEAKPHIAPPTKDAAIPNQTAPTSADTSKAEETKPVAREKKASSQPPERQKTTPPNKRAKSHTRVPMKAKTKSKGPKKSKEEKAAIVRNLIDEKAKLLESQADHFQLLEVARDAKEADIRKLYFNLAKQLHPDRLKSLGLENMTQKAQTIFGEINIAFSVLSDSKKRKVYVEEIEGGSAESAEAEALAMRLLGAEEHFHMGQVALRANQFLEAKKQFKQAVELNPEDPSFQAHYAWTIWCGSTDKSSVQGPAKKGLKKAISISKECAPAWLFRGMIAKQEDNVTKAAKCFENVLELEPGNRQAEAELRLLNRRTGKGKSSLFRRR